jgi:transcriptional regulator with XRE-family HTH domain
MADGLDAAVVLRRAREQMGLSQRELAKRAGTAQSVVARIESGVTSPTLSTLNRLLTALGLELRAEVTPRAEPDESVLEDVRRVLSLTPEERLLEVRNVTRFLAAARRV